MGQIERADRGEEQRTGFRVQLKSGETSFHYVGDRTLDAIKGEMGSGAGKRRRLGDVFKRIEVAKKRSFLMSIAGSVRNKKKGGES